MISRNLQKQRVQKCYWEKKGIFSFFCCLLNYWCELVWTLKKKKVSQVKKELNKLPITLIDRLWQRKQRLNGNLLGGSFSSLQVPCCCCCCCCWREECQCSGHILLQWFGKFCVIYIAVIVFVIVPQNIVNECNEVLLPHWLAVLSSLLRKTTW